MRKNRPRMKFESRLFPVKDGYAENIGRQQVAGELDAVKSHAHYLRHGVRQRGLADTRLVFDQAVAAGEQAGQRQFYLVVFAQYHLTYVCDGVFE